MERVELPKVPWPEVTLIACGLILVLFVMLKSSTDTCHRWKQQLSQVSGAFLGAAGSSEFPQPKRDVEEERAALRQAARQLLDRRPFACL